MTSKFKNPRIVALKIFHFAIRVFAFLDKYMVKDFNNMIPVMTRAFGKNRSKQFSKEPCLKELAFKELQE